MEQETKAEIAANLAKQAAAIRAARIKACQHPEPVGVGLGYAICNDCGALLPDEDPDLRAKCGLPPIQPTT